MLAAIHQKTYFVVKAADGTRKIHYFLKDGFQVEACVLDLSYRPISRVICISSQVGCPFSCDFCESGHRDLLRNLTVEEIVEQVAVAKDVVKDPDERPFDVTYMGIGEPLANFDTVVRSFEMLLAVYPSIDHLNVSTVGPRGGIGRLAGLPLKGRLHLQLSLHTPFEKERLALFRKELPTAEEQVDALFRFGEVMQDTPCVNYLLFEGVNDTPRHAHALLKLLIPGRCYLKVSSFCQIARSTLRPSSESTRARFIAEIKAGGLTVKSFDSHGQDVHAGCGQLIAECE